MDTALARAFEPYLRWVGRLGRWAWTDARARHLKVGEIEAKLSSLTQRTQPIIITYYIADALGVAALGLMHQQFGDLLRSVRCLVDDTVAGRASGSLIAHLGGRMSLLPRADDPDRVRAVYAVIRGGESCAFPVDGGGPYREVGTGIVGLAVSLRATIVPIAVRARRAVVLAPRSRVRVPIPGSWIVGAIGTSVAVARAGDRRAVAGELKRALDELATAVRAFR